MNLMSIWLYFWVQLWATKCEAEINAILLYSMQNGWGEHDFLQCLDFEVFIFKKETEILKHMNIVEYVYEGVVEPSTKNN